MKKPALLCLLGILLAVPAASLNAFFGFGFHFGVPCRPCVRVVQPVQTVHVVHHTSPRLRMAGHPVRPQRRHRARRVVHRNHHHCYHHSPQVNFGFGFCC